MNSRETSGCTLETRGFLLMWARRFTIAVSRHCGPLHDPTSLQRLSRFTQLPCERRLVLLHLMLFLTQRFCGAWSSCVWGLSAGMAMSHGSSKLWDSHFERKGKVWLECTEPSGDHREGMIRVQGLLFNFRAQMRAPSETETANLPPPPSTQRNTTRSLGFGV